MHFELFNKPMPLNAPATLTSPFPAEPIASNDIYIITANISSCTERDCLSLYIRESRNVICSGKKTQLDSVQETYRLDFVILLLMPFLIEKRRLAQDLRKAFVSHSERVLCKKVRRKIRDCVLYAVGF